MRDHRDFSDAEVVTAADLLRTVIPLDRLAQAQGPSGQDPTRSAPGSMAGSMAGSVEAVVGAVLSRREREVLTLVGEGLTAKTIGHRLGISASTVGKHLEHAYAKLGRHDRLLAVDFARQHRLIPRR